LRIQEVSRLSAKPWMLFASIGAFLLAFADPASAQYVTAYAPTQGSPNSVTLNIPVTASVGGRCGFASAPSGSHTENNFDDHAWQKDFSFQLDCTGAFRVAVVSTNGGLKTAGTAPAGYTTIAPYNVALHVVGNTSTVDSPTCAAATLVSGSTCSYVGTATNTVGFRYAGSSTLQSGSYLRVSAPAYTGSSVLVASTGYTDTLTVTVSAAP
jgi:hypothetical protein